MRRLIALLFALSVIAGATAAYAETDFGSGSTYEEIEAP